MSLAKFKQLIDQLIDEDANIITIKLYIQDNKDALIELLDGTDPYIPILRCFLKTSLTDFIKTQFPWKIIQKCYFGFDIDALLTKQDLEVERMVGVNNSQFYFNILEIFLIDHKVNEIPESFIKHYENINQCYMIHFADYINIVFFDHLSNLHQTIFPEKIVSQRIELLILFLERFNMKNTNIYDVQFNTKEDLLRALIDNFYDSDHYDETGEVIYTVDGVIVTENNVIDFCLAKLKNDDENDFLDEYDGTYDFTDVLADYFEYMRLDQQMDFWNIFIEEDKDTIESIFYETGSDTFLNFAFDNYEPLKTEDGVYNIILTYHKLEDSTLNFYHMALQRYPSIRSNLIIYLVIVDNYVCKRLFPDLTNQEIISIFRAKFL